MPQKMREAAAKIVSSYIRRNQLAFDQIGTVISAVYETLTQLGNRVEDDKDRTPAVSIKRSVTRDYVICLDCGSRWKMLKRHLSTAHGITAEEYRARWGLPRDYPLIAPAYAERRSSLAKNLGFGKRRTEPKKAVADISIAEEGNPGIDAPQPAEPQQEQAA
jgi:predicted transcriptional regulator